MSRGKPSPPGHRLLPDRTCECGQKPPAPTSRYDSFSKWRSRHIVDVRMAELEKADRRRLLG